MPHTQRKKTKPATALLTALAKKINRGLETERELGLKRAAQIQQIGKWLIEAKGLVRANGGRWEPWVEANLKCDADTPGLYMLAYRQLGGRNPEWIRFLPPTLSMQVALARLAKRASDKPIPFFPELESDKVRQKLAEPSGREILEEAIANGDIKLEMSWDDIRKLSAPARPIKRTSPAMWDDATEECAFHSALRQAIRRVAEGWLTRCPSGQVSRVEILLRESRAAEEVADELRERRDKRGRLTSSGVEILTRLQQKYAALPGIALYVAEARALKRVLDGKIATWHEMELLDETLDAQTPEDATR